MAAARTHPLQFFPQRVEIPVNPLPAFSSEPNFYHAMHRNSHKAPGSVWQELALLPTQGRSEAAGSAPRAEMQPLLLVQLCAMALRSSASGNPCYVTESDNSAKYEACLHTYLLIHAFTSAHVLTYSMITESRCCSRTIKSHTTAHPTALTAPTPRAARPAAARAEAVPAAAVMARSGCWVTAATWRSAAACSPSGARPGSGWRGDAGLWMRCDSNSLVATLCEGTAGFPAARNL